MTTTSPRPAHVAVLVVRYAAVVLLAGLFLLPFYVMLKTAVSSPADIASFHGL